MARPAGGMAGRRPRAARRLAAAAALLLLAAAAPAWAQQPGGSGNWQIVTDMSAAQGWEYSLVGPRQRPFARPAPRSLDASLLSDFEPAFNLLQDVSPAGDNLFADTSDQYVATLHRAFVEGESGLVSDAAGRIFHPPFFHFNRTSPLAPMPQRTPGQACEWYPSLATVVQRYGGMYYHFLEEALPRVAMLAQSGALTSDVKLLTWGQPYEFQYLEMLGVSREQVAPYNASRLYCADRLLMPTPTPRITPPREALQLVRSGLGVQTLPEAERDLLIYVSRRNEPSRRVENEEALLAAISAAFPSTPLVVFTGDLPAEQTIRLFQRARLVVGPHGAGLSHILFSAPGTTVVEFLFLADPPLMFWHTAAALGQAYWMLPVPQAFWMQDAMQVPVDEVIDILTAALVLANPDATCAAGNFAYLDPAIGTEECSSCPVGSYSFAADSQACKPCSPGRYAGEGAVACRTCQPGTYSSPDGTACLACPEGTFSMLPGAWSQAQCLTPEQRRRQQEDQAFNVQMLSKLSPVFAEARRRLIQQGSGSGAPTQAELCAAQKAMSGGFADPYRGPYLMTGLAGNAALLANCNDSALPSPSPVVVVASPPAPAVLEFSAPSPASLPSPSVALPPLDAPILPPVLLSPLPVDPRTVTAQGTPVDTPPQVPLPTPVPSPASPAPSVYPEKKKAVDNNVIILACVLGSLLVLPLLAWLIRRCYLARQHRKSRAGATPASAPLVGHTSNAAAYDNPAYDAEDAGSTGSGRSGAKLTRASPL